MAALINDGGTINTTWRIRVQGLEGLVGGVYLSRDDVTYAPDLTTGIMSFTRVQGQYLVIEGRGHPGFSIRITIQVPSQSTYDLALIAALATTAPGTSGGVLITDGVASFRAGTLSIIGASLAESPANQANIIITATGSFASLTGAPTDNAALATALGLKSDLASPTFTGTVTVPTPSVSGAAATKGYVDSALIGAGAVLSVFGRTGAVVAANNDYTFAQLASKPTTLAAYGITDAQGLDSDLTAIAAIAPSNDDIIQRKAGAWTNRTPAQLKTDLVLVKADVGLGNLTNLLQLVAANNLSDLANAGTARTNLGLGTLATQSGTFSGTSSGTNTGDQDLSGLVPNTRTVNGQALSSNVTVSTITGNAGTATALQTARNINGVAFDGSANITVTAAAGTLSGATLASGVTASSLTSFGASPSLTTPLLGTPTSGTLTNCTGLPIASGISGLGTGIATFLATPSSANLAAAVTNETGSGALVFATSPTLVTPALGTPTALVLTSATGLPPTTGIAGWPSNSSGVLTNDGSGTLSWAASGGSGTVTHTGALTSGQLLKGNGSADITVGDLSGDISTSGTLVTAIGAGKVTNTMLAGSIAYSKLSLTGAILNADLAGSIADTKLSTISTAGKVSDSALSSNIPLKNAANTFTAGQTITPAANTAAFTVSSYSLSGSNAQSLLDISGTWNTTGTPALIKANITNTASNAASLLMDLQVGGASKFSVDRDGNIAASALTARTIILNDGAGGESATPLNLDTLGRIFLGDSGNNFIDINPAGLNQWHAHPEDLNLDTIGKVQIGDPNPGAGNFTRLEINDGSTYALINAAVGTIKLGDADRVNLLTLFTVDTSNQIFAFESGSVAMGTPTPAASALLTMVSTTQGLLPPRMTTTQRDAISSPAEGLFIYNTTTHVTNYWNGSAWVTGGGTYGLTVATTTITSGSNTKVLFNNSGVVGEYTITGTGNVAMSASPTFTGTVAAGSATYSGTIIQTNNSGTIFAAGRQGATNPVLALISSGGSDTTGISITAAGGGSAVAIAATSSSGSEALSISTKGTANLTLTGSTLVMNGLVDMSAGGFRSLTSSSGMEDNITRIGMSLGSAHPIFWTSGVPTASPTVGIQQNASGIIEINSGTAGTFRDLVSRNVKLGATTSRGTTEGTNTLSLFNGTAPAGTLTNGVSFYASSGEAYVIDSGGLQTLLSSHDTAGYRVFDSTDTRTGKRTVIDAERLLRFLNDHFGTDFVHEYEVTV